jgi:hypothetical protein
MSSTEEGDKGPEIINDSSDATVDDDEYKEGKVKEENEDENTKISYSEGDAEEMDHPEDKPAEEEEMSEKPALPSPTRRISIFFSISAYKLTRVRAWNNDRSTFLIKYMG